MPKKIPGRLRPAAIIPSCRSLEYRILQVLWAYGATSLPRIEDLLPQEEPAPSGTVRSTVSRMVANGAVRRVSKVSKVQVFEAAIAPAEAYSQLVDEFGDILDGAMDYALQRLMQTGRLKPRDLDTLSESRGEAAREPDGGPASAHRGSPAPPGDRAKTEPKARPASPPAELR